MDAVAERHHSVISSVMLGALAGSGVLPFRKAAFEAVIKKGGIAVDTNLAAFEDAYQRAERGGDDVEVSRAGTTVGASALVGAAAADGAAAAGPTGAVAGTGAAVGVGAVVA